MLQVIVISGLFASTVLASFGAEHASNQWQGSVHGNGHHGEEVYNVQNAENNHFPQLYDHVRHSFNSYGHYNLDDHSNVEKAGQALHGQGIFGHGEGWDQHTNYHAGQSVPVSRHVEVTKPYLVPVVKNIGVPIAHPVAIPVPHTIAVEVPQPYPVHVPVAQHVPIPVIKTIAVPVEKKVPYAIERIIPVPVEKPVPISVEKYIPVPVEQPYPIHIPVYKHVFHRAVKHGHTQSRRGSHGW